MVDHYNVWDLVRTKFKMGRMKGILADPNSIYNKTLHNNAKYGPSFMLFSEINVLFVHVSFCLGRMSL